MEQGTFGYTRFKTKDVIRTIREKGYEGDVNYLMPLIGENDPPGSRLWTQKFTKTFTDEVLSSLRELDDKVQDARKERDSDLTNKEARERYAAVMKEVADKYDEIENRHFGTKE